jgi:hypothetical protein
LVVRGSQGKGLIWQLKAAKEKSLLGCPWQLGMDSDVWKSELSIFVSAKNVNMDIHIRIRF